MLAITFLDALDLPNRSMIYYGYLLLLWTIVAGVPICYVFLCLEIIVKVENEVWEYGKKCRFDGNGLKAPEKK